MKDEHKHLEIGDWVKIKVKGKKRPVDAKVFTKTKDGSPIFIMPNGKPVGYSQVEIVDE